MRDTTFTSKLSWICFTISYNNIHYKDIRISPNQLTCTWKSQSNSVTNWQHLRNHSRTLSSDGQRYKYWNVAVIFLENLGPKTSLSVPNWWRDWRTIESITYNPGTLYSGLHWKQNNFLLYTDDNKVAIFPYFPMRNLHLAYQSTEKKQQKYLFLELYELQKKSWMA